MKEIKFFTTLFFSFVFFFGPVYGSEQKITYLWGKKGVCRFCDRDSKDVGRHEAYRCLLNLKRGLVRKNNALSSVGELVNRYKIKKSPTEKKEIDFEKMLKREENKKVRVADGGHGLLQAIPSFMFSLPNSLKKDFEPSTLESISPYPLSDISTFNQYETPGGEEVSLDRFELSDKEKNEQEWRRDVFCNEYDTQLINADLNE